MRDFRKFGWWGLFALIPLSIGLIVLDDAAPMSETWHMIVLGVIVVVICVLADGWVKRNYLLLEHKGADADALVAHRALPGITEGADTTITDGADREPSQAGGERPLAVPPVIRSGSGDE